MKYTKLIDGQVQPTFESIHPFIFLFNKPVYFDIESQLDHLQLYLYELQCDPSINTLQDTGVEFWKLISPKRYRLLRNWSLKLSSISESTYMQKCVSSLNHNLII